MRFRTASRRDLERLVEIHLAAYPDERSVAARERNFTHNRLGSLDELVVVEADGSLVGHAFLFPLRAWFGGRAVKLGGIASVGVAPEARGRGVATALIAHLHVLSDRRGDVATMLYAFRQGFYARLGYASTSSRKRLAFAPRSVPRAWCELARERVRAPRGGEHEALRRLHEEFAAGATGVIARPKRHWEKLLANERRHVLVCERTKSRSREEAFAGYVAFTIAQDEPHAVTRIEVEELVAEDQETRRALVGALGAMRDQCSEVIVELAETDPLERALVDPDAHRHGTSDVEHPLGEIVGGPMIRVGDVARALEARGYRGSGSFEVVVRDGGDEYASGVEIHDGRPKLRPPRGGAGITTSQTGFAAIFYGALSVKDAIALGMAEADPAIVPRVDELVRIPPLAPIDAF
jgi:predicted acetyltransferase